MPIDPNADVEITGFIWVPEFARGFVRDLRPRWACEEAGIAYRERLIDFEASKGEDYLREQPFGQVPAYQDGEVQMFESGAMVLHIAQRSERLMPRNAAGQARVLTWVTAALNSVEPSSGTSSTSTSSTRARNGPFCAGPRLSKTYAGG